MSGDAKVPGMGQSSFSITEHCWPVPGTFARYSLFPCVLGTAQKRFSVWGFHWTVPSMGMVALRTSELRRCFRERADEQKRLFRQRITGACQDSLTAGKGGF